MIANACRIFGNASPSRGCDRDAAWEKDAAILKNISEEVAVEQSTFLSILANRHRLHILFLLRERDYYVGEITCELRETLVAVSRHLTILRENNIITARRCGQIVRYSLTCKKTARMMETIAELRAGEEPEPLETDTRMAAPGHQRRSV